MDGLVYLLRDVFVWLFENTLEKLENIPNIIFVVLCFAGLFIWLRMQSKYNAEAESNPDQIK